MLRYTIAEEVIANARLGLDGAQITLAVPAHHTNDEFESFLASHYPLSVEKKDGNTIYRIENAPDRLQGMTQLLAAIFDVPIASLLERCDEPVRARLATACLLKDVGQKITIPCGAGSNSINLNVKSCAEQKAICAWLQNIYHCDFSEGPGQSLSVKLALHRDNAEPVEVHHDLPVLLRNLQNAWGMDRHTVLNLIAEPESRQYAEEVLSIRPDPQVEDRIGDRQYTQDVIIVGSGFSGISAAIHVLKDAINNPQTAPIRLSLVEKAEDRFAGGLAYGEAGAEHRVNVEAKYLSLDANNPDDFVDWLKETRPSLYGGLDSGLTIPDNLNIPTEDVEQQAVQRNLYQYYLLHRLNEYIDKAAALGVADAQIIFDEVSALEKTDDQVTLNFASGRIETRSHVILATGHGPVIPPRFISEVAEMAPERVITDQWGQKEQLLEILRNPDTSHVTVLGTGLSAMDVIMTADKNGYFDNPAHKLLLVSRGGNIHPVLDPTKDYAQPDLKLSDLGDLPKNVGEVQGFVTRAVSYARLRGMSEIGRDYTDEEIFFAMTPLIPEFIEKSGLPAGELFAEMKKYSSLINTTAVSMAPVIGAAFQKYSDSGQLEVVSGNTSGINLNEDNQLEINFGRGKAEIQPLVQTQAVISTLPPQAQPQAIPLYKDLLNQGMLRIEPETQFGLDLDFKNMTAIAADGTAHRNIFVIGPIAGGEAMKTEGRIGPAYQIVSGLRLQADKIADALLEDRNASSRPTVALLMSSAQDQSGASICSRWKHALENYGLRVLLVPPGLSDAGVDHITNNVHGVLLPGGDANVHPKNYGQEPIPGQLFDQARDDTAFKLVRACRDKGTPLLGVCRGAQEINVALGGSLQQNIGEGHDHGYTDPEARKEEVHDINIVGKGLLSKIYGDQTRFGVTSIHRQGMYTNDLAKDLRPEAMDEKGRVVEAFSHAAHNFMVGVQFHPEFESLDPENAKIFMAYAEAVDKKCRESTTQMPLPHLDELSRTPKQIRSC
ncbi:MAG: gamma-glutamyl-gamma-aminobutyrate hydrolase family protein [Micavibrio sp.]